MVKIPKDETKANTVKDERLKDVDDAYILRDTLREDRFSLICVAMRPGCMAFAVVLEHTFFSPLDPALNDELQFYSVKWQGLPWQLITIPRAKIKAAEEAAEMVGMKLHMGAFPNLIDHEGDHPWPFINRHNDNYANLESLPGDPCYHGLAEEAQEAERLWCKNFFVEWDKKHGTNCAANWN